MFKKFHDYMHSAATLLVSLIDFRSEKHLFFLHYQHTSIAKKLLRRELLGVYVSNVLWNNLNVIQSNFAWNFAKSQRKRSKSQCKPTENSLYQSAAVWLKLLYDVYVLINDVLEGGYNAHAISPLRQHRKKKKKRKKVWQFVIERTA